MSGVTGVTFMLYKEEQGGSPLWIETQNITPDESGHYTATLGSVKLDSSLADSFASGEARSLAVQIGQQEEQARALLAAAPDRLQARGPQTIGGLAPSPLTSGHTNPSAH